MQEMQERYVWSLGREDLLEKEMATAPIFLPGKFHGQGGWWVAVHGFRAGRDWATEHILTQCWGPWVRSHVLHGRAKLNKKEKRQEFHTSSLEWNKEFEEIKDHNAFSSTVKISTPRIITEADSNGQKRISQMGSWADTSTLTLRK